MISTLPTLLKIADELNSPVSLIQTTIPLFLLVMGIGQLVTGPLVDNFGLKLIALISLALYIIGSAMPWQRPLLWPMFFLALVN